MVSQPLKNLFLLSALLFIAHGIEELATKMYATDSHVQFVFKFVENMTPIHAAFLVFQIMLGLLLVIGYLLLLGPKWQLHLLVIPGLVFIYELHHLYKAVEAMGYYPGMFTAIILYIVGFFFWKELIINYKKL